MSTNTGRLITAQLVIQWGVTNEDGDIKLEIPVSPATVYGKEGPLNSFMWINAYGCHIGQSNLEYLVIGVEMRATIEAAKNHTKYGAYDHAMGVI